MKQLLSKLTSRKFLLALISMAAGIAALCGADKTIIDIVAGAAMTVLPALVYCIIEGHIDAASIKAAQNAVVDAADALGADQNVQDIIHAAGDMLTSIDEQSTK